MVVQKKRIHLMIPFLLAILLTLTVFSENTVHASNDGFSEELNSLNTELWYTSDLWANGGTFGNGWRGDHVEFDSGTMALRLDDQLCPSGCSDKPYASGEYATNNTYGYGRVEARIKVAKGDGLVTSLFIYSGPTQGTANDEIDIEILGKDTTKMETNYFTNGVGKHGTVIDLRFDAAENFHDYAFEWSPKAIKWYVDDVLVHTEIGKRGRLPTVPGQIMVNLWSGTGAAAAEWTKPFVYANSPIRAYYDWIKFTSLDADVTKTGSIAVTVLNDDKKTPISEPLAVKITDKNGRLVTSTSDTISITEGTFTSANTLAKGTYYVTISDGNIEQTTEVRVATKPIRVKLIWESTLTGIKDSKGTIKKSGAITGIVYDGTADTATVATDATVKIISKKTTWSTKTNKNGSFKVYVPAGIYDVIVEGRDSANVDDKKNIIYKKIKVTAGQAAAPLQQLNASLTWETVDKDLDFVLTESSLTGKNTTTASKSFTGKALANSTVSVYTVTSGDTVKTWVAETKTKKNGEFNVKVPSLAGERVLFRVQDEAGNIYEAIVEVPPIV